MRMFKKRLPSQIALPALLMFLVGNPVQSTFADTPDLVVIALTETIAVADDPTVVGPAVISVTETVTVAESVESSDPKLELLLRLSQPAFFGDVTEVAEDRFMVTTNPEVLPLITNDTVINSPGTAGSQQIAVGQRVAVVANEAPAIGVDLSDKDLATALTVTVIPEKALRHHRQCAAVKKEGQNMILACDDGTTVEISASQLSPGDSVVMLFQPEQPERLVTTGTRLLERLERMASRATRQGQAELASKLNDIQENTKKNFGAKFGGIRDAAPPDLKALMNDMISSIEKLTGAVVAGDTQVAIGADDLAQVSENLEHMLGFMDQMTEILVKRRLNKISEKAREAVEETGSQSN